MAGRKHLVLVLGGRDIKPATTVIEDLAVARARRLLRLVPKPLAYCRPPDNDQRRR